VSASDRSRAMTASAGVNDEGLGIDVRPDASTDPRPDVGGRNRVGPLGRATEGLRRRQRGALAARVFFRPPSALLTSPGVSAGRVRRGGPSAIVKSCPLRVPISPKVLIASDDFKGGP